MENVFANRLMSARKMAGMSLQDLADKSGNVVTKQALSKYEQNKMKPDSEVLIALSKALNVSVDYFYSEPTIKVELTNIDFRKLVSRLSKTDEEAVIEKAKVGFERYFELEDMLSFHEKPNYFIHPKEIKTDDDAELAAKSLRQEWNLGYDPIPDIVEMLEDKGYKVIEIEAPDSFDGLKANSNSEKVIVLKKNKNEGDDIVRKRFTALHELAHHALKISDKLNEREKEKICHVFACAVLYPEDMARKELHKERFHFYQKELELIKERWGISFTAIFNRALRLGIINDYVYKKFNIGYRGRNYHKPNQEPGRFLSKEKPVRMERLVYFGLAKEILTINEAAYYLDTSVWEFREQMHQMV